jgi:hypothetical protein
MRAEIAALLEEETGKEMMVADVAARAMVRPTRDNAEHVAQARADVAERHTGNHRPRAHAVAVLTAPGQPVRG